MGYIAGRECVNAHNSFNKSLFLINRNHPPVSLNFLIQQLDIGVKRSLSHQGVCGDDRSFCRRCASLTCMRPVSTLRLLMGCV